MSILGIDLGGTKLSTALFSELGEIRSNEVIHLNHKKGHEVGKLITDEIKKYLQNEGTELKSIGVSVPGISNRHTGTVWAPNISGWDDYPLLEEIKNTAGIIPVSMDSDRACSILGELWQGNARECKDAIFLSVGTGIGAGIMVNGEILRGSADIAGAVGWMALEKPYQKKFDATGCFEYYSSGEGIVRLACETLEANLAYGGILKNSDREQLTAQDVFHAYENDDTLAINVIKQCVEFWGMATANLVSIFNPEKIIFGGGVFGPGVKFISAIKKEAKKWAQPISITQVSFEPSALLSDAAVYGAAFLAMKNMNQE